MRMNLHLRAGDTPPLQCVRSHRCQFVREFMNAVGITQADIVGASSGGAMLRRSGLTPTETLRERPSRLSLLQVFLNVSINLYILVGSARLHISPQSSEISQIFP